MVVMNRTAPRLPLQLAILSIITHVAMVNVYRKVAVTQLFVTADRTVLVSQLLDFFLS